MNMGYRVGEFAQLAGVTVRTLHHYDRIGLLIPQRNSAGVRIYSLDDLERLEQIAALKFLGISLKEVRYLLGSSKTPTLLESFTFQLSALQEKRKAIDNAMRAIELATNTILSGHATDASILKTIMETIDMQPQENFMRKYYAEQAWIAKTKFANETPPEVIKERGDSWKQLFQEVEAAIDIDPASEATQALARRWMLLADVSAGSNDGVLDGAVKAWKDHENWPLLQQDALLKVYGLDTGDRTASMKRIELVANLIGRAISHKVRSDLRALYKVQQTDRPIK
jgi:DNA-binding transcriptional MerR regulator